MSITINGVHYFHSHITKYSVSGELSHRLKIKLTLSARMDMTLNLEQILRTVELLLHNQSPAHDFQHILRVYRNAEMISKKEEGADLDIVLAAALLHDLVVYPKGSRRTNHSADESADLAKKILSEYKKLPGYDKSIDLWSFGIMNYHVLSCQCPWNSLSSEDTIKLYDEISKGIQSYSAFRGIRKDMSEDEFENISDFISNLCHIDNKLRINADEALKHRVFI